MVLGSSETNRTHCAGMLWNRTLIAPTTGSQIVIRAEGRDLSAKSRPTIPAAVRFGTHHFPHDIGCTYRQSSSDRRSASWSGYGIGTNSAAGLGLVQPSKGSYRTFAVDSGLFRKSWRSQPQRQGIGRTVRRGECFQQIDPFRWRGIPARAYTGRSHSHKSASSATACIEIVPGHFWGGLPP
jgi:hypothetical protein